MFTVITKIFAHRCTRIRSNVLCWCRIRCICCHNGCVFHGTICFQLLNERSNGGCFLSNRYINTVNGFFCFMSVSLVDDGINGNSRFSRLTITNNQLTLTAANGDHTIHSFDTSLQGFSHRLTSHDTQRFPFNRK